MTEQTFLIVTDRPWSRPLGDRLQRRVAGQWHTIESEAELTRATLQRLKPRFVFFPHWSKHIPAEVYETFECVIFHMTDLPYGRGGSPLQNLIARGHTETKMTALRCVEQFDAGPVYLKRDFSLHGTAEEIFLRAADLIEEMIVEIVAKEPDPVPQEGEPVIFRRRRPADGDLADKQTLDELYDFIRMLDAQGYPPAFLEVGRFRLEFHRAARRCGELVADVRIVEKEDTSNDD